MIEIKLSQGAKPGHGGVLPAAKVTEEIAAIRGVPAGRDCLSPARHSAFSTPLEMMGFIAELRRLSGGKPVGFKLCVGHPWEFLAICKAMLETGIRPDFIVVDGKEGGTGAAPLEFADHLGMPMRDGLVFVRNALVGAGLRGDIRIGVSGKIANAFDMACAMALGADWCNSARGFMFALGCIQSLSCHTDRCPTGVATQDKTRSRALVVEDKTERVRNYHRSMLNALAELTAAAGLEHARDFRPIHFSRRVGASETKTFAELYPQLQPGELIAGASDGWWREQWDAGALRPLRRRRLRRRASEWSGRRSSHQRDQVVAAEIDRDRRAARRQVGGAAVEGVDDNGGPLEPHPHAHHRAEEGDVLDDAGERVAAVVAGAEAQRFGPQRHRQHVARLRAVELAPRRRTLAVDVDRAGRRVDDLAVEKVERADEGGDEAGARRVVDFARRPDLLDRAVVHHDDAVGHRQRLFLVVGDEDRGDAEACLQRADFLAQRDANARVERRQRLVEQQDLRARARARGRARRAAAGRRRADRDSGRRAAAA